MGLLLLLNACSTTSVNSSLNTMWRGKTVDQLIAQRGVPTHIAHLANGHTSYIYMTSRIQPFPYPETTNQFIVAGPRGASIGYAIPSVNPSTYTLHCQMVFDIDQKNQIIAVDASPGC